jgi:glycosyltransferase involved in cell wall biosynthesis
VRILVVCEQRFAAGPNGSVWTTTSQPQAFWSRYLGAFSQVMVLARVAPPLVVSADAQRADGPGVQFSSLPYYVGPREFLRVATELRRQIRGTWRWGDAVIVRAYSPLSTQLLPRLARLGYPYALEVVSDPQDAFAPGGVRHPLRPIFRRWFSRSLRRQCLDAIAVAYVTESTLQQRYPARPTTFTTHYSSVALEDGDLFDEPRTFSEAPRSPHLVFVGSLAQMYKGPDVLIDAAARCVAQAVDLQLTIVGEGRHRPELERRARDLGIADRVRFTGELPAGTAVRAILDQADLFVLPSRTEGLPRALIEAMARALPCIGTAIGGIPELLPADDLVPPNDVEALAARVSAVVREPARLGAMSARNLARAREFRDSVLRERRDRFYAEVRERTMAWLRAHPQPPSLSPP